MKKLPAWVLRHRLKLLLAALIVVAIGFAQYLTPYVPKGDATYVERSGSSYVRATVTDVSATGLTVTLRDGPRAGQIVQLKDVAYMKADHGDIGKEVIVRVDDLGFGAADWWRIPVIVVAGALFVALVVAIGRKKGLMSLLGLFVSMVVLSLFVIPGILEGRDTFMTIVSGAFLIAVVSIFVAHGVSRRTAVSVVCIASVLLVVALLSLIAMEALSLTGMIDEISSNLSVSRPEINLSGLVAGSIIIATLGILDDVVTTQVATIDHLVAVHPKMRFDELVRRGMDVGREHVAALVNTLALAYVGISFPLILMYAAGAGYANPWLFFNSEFFAQEAVRMLLSSAGLLLAVPLSTYVAATWFSRNRPSWISSAATRFIRPR